ncbi:MAG: DUF169 domain-containing protein [Armatimonadota bacterium]
MTHKEMASQISRELGLVEEPIAVYYADEKPEQAFQWNCQGGHFCHMGRLTAVIRGTPLAVDRENPGCGGAAFFLGWNAEMQPGFEEFLSHDADGKGERYKKTPEIAKAFVEKRSFVPANGRYCIFQRLEDLPEKITPEVIVLYGDADDMSGLLGLANYGRKNQAVIAPFSSGCGSIVSEPRAQGLGPEPKAVLGMFDPSARGSVNKNYLTFSAPWQMFIEMLENIPGSFLEIDPWLKLRNR